MLVTLFSLMITDIKSLSMFLGSTHIHLNQTVRVGTEGTREIIEMVPVEITMNLKMGSLARMGKFNSSLLSISGFCFYVSGGPAVHEHDRLMRFEELVVVNFRKGFF